MSRNVDLLRLATPPDPNKIYYQDDHVLWVKHMHEWSISLVQHLERHSDIADKPLIIDREKFFQGKASNEYGGEGIHKFRLHQEWKARFLRSAISTTGTSTAGDNYVVSIGGTAVGTLTYGTGAADVLGTLTIDKNITSMQEFKLQKGTAQDATVDLTLDYELRFKP